MPMIYYTVPSQGDGIPTDKGENSIRPVIDPGVDWSGLLLGDGKYLIATYRDLPDVPAGQSRGERKRITNLNQFARQYGLDATIIQDHLYVVE